MERSLAGKKSTSTKRRTQLKTQLTEKNSQLSKEKMLEIECVVSKIISNLNLEQSPSIDIVSLVKKDGFLVQSGDLPINTTGYLIVNDKTPVDTTNNYHRLIVVNNKFKNPDNEDNVILKKSRFITAHEYGHYKLHKLDDVPLFAHRDNDKRETPQELEADFFARSILMPKKIFTKYNKSINKILEIDHGQNNIVDNDNINMKLDILSSLFKVTKNKVLKRLEDIDVMSSI